MLLKEMLSHNRPPDLTGQVLGRIERSQRRLWYIGTGAVAAAAAIIIAFMFVISRPVTFEQKQVADFVDPPRDTMLEAKIKVRKLSLGDYCLIDIDPGSQVIIEGHDGAEQIYLRRGKVVCDVDSGKGGFTVRTVAGSVVVKGTRFSVGVIDASMSVEVMEGTVAAIGEWGERVLRAGESATLPELRRVEQKDEPKIDPVPEKPDVKQEKPKITAPVKTPETSPAVKEALEALEELISQYADKHGVSAAEAGQEIAKQLEDSGQDADQDGVREMVNKYAEEKGISTEQAEKEIGTLIQQDSMKEDVGQYARDKGVSVVEARRQIMGYLGRPRGPADRHNSFRKMVEDYAREKGISIEQARREISSLIRGMGRFPESRPKPPPRRPPPGPRNGWRGGREHPPGPRRGPR
jgi:hypothetical protein